MCRRGSEVAVDAGGTRMRVFERRRSAGALPVVAIKAGAIGDSLSDRRRINDHHPTFRIEQPNSDHREPVKILNGCPTVAMAGRARRRSGARTVWNRFGIRVTAHARKSAVNGCCEEAFIDEKSRRVPLERGVPVAREALCVLDRSRRDEHQKQRDQATITSLSCETR